MSASLKLISTTSESEYERLASELLTDGYKPVGELRIEPFKESYVGGDNCWHWRTGYRYIREMIRENSECLAS